MNPRTARLVAGEFIIATLLPMAAPAQAQVPVPLGDIVSGSAGGDGIATGSSAAGSELALEPPPSFAPQVATGDPVRSDPAPVAEPAPTDSAEPLGLDTGSVAAACTGSALAGGSAILLGSATGSGSAGPSLIGPVLIAPGSSGSGLGSAATGSAITGSALLTCLLLVPVPAAPPGIPLRLDPLPPPLALPAPAVTPPSPWAQTPAAAPESPATNAVDTAAGRRNLPQAVAPVADPVAWNVLELVTVLLVTVVAAIRMRAAPGANGVVGPRSDRV